MEIKNATSTLVDPYRNRLEATGQEIKDRARQTEGAPRQAQGDRISLSPEALLHTEARAAAMSTPDIRRGKVDSVRERLAAGTYTVDSKNIAKKLLQSDAELSRTMR